MGATSAGKCVEWEAATPETLCKAKARSWQNAQTKAFTNAWWHIFWSHLVNTYDVLWMKVRSAISSKGWQIQNCAQKSKEIVNW